jgi:glycosyltransferase involved in cell wall biosynthesis
LGVSSEIVDWIARLGARHPARALVPPPPGRPSRPEKEVRQELGVPDDHFLIVTVARLAGQKGLPLLVATAARLKDRPLTWVIAGEGPLRAQLEAIIKKRDLPVRPLGRRPDVPDLLGAADAVVSTSLTEGQPVALQQALAAGCAVVATDVGGTRETLADGATLVAPEAGALADGIGHLLDDPAARDALRRRAAARAAALPTLQDLETQLRWAYGAQRSPNG